MNEFFFFAGKENKKKKKEKPEPKTKDQKKGFEVIEPFPQVKKSKPKQDTPSDSKSQNKNVKKDSAPSAGNVLLSAFRYF